MSKVYVWQEHQGRERYRHPMWMGVSPGSAGEQVVDLAWAQRLGEPAKDDDVFNRWLSGLTPGHWARDHSNRKDVRELYADALEKMRAGT